MFCCAKCGALIDLGFTEFDCPKGCYDEDTPKRYCNFCRKYTDTEDENCVVCKLSKTHDIGKLPKHKCNTCGYELVKSLNTGGIKYCPVCVSPDWC